MFNFLQNLANFTHIIDVRSPIEFEESHIPNALNLAVLNNCEFKKIGLLYKQNAFESNYLGAEIVLKNISTILKNNKNIFNYKNNILIYCARGGNRSLSLYQVLKALKFRVQRIDGGYKAYRKNILEFFNTSLENNKFINHRFLTLCGNTGCGKSEIIKMANTWSVDLEELCNHFGSSFGFIAGIQPSVKMFENNIVNDLLSKKSQILLIENESIKLGKIIIPKNLYLAYQNTHKILINTNLENRIKRVMSLYKNIKEEDFLNALNKISPYISKNIKNDILKAFENGNKFKVTEILIIKYYDKVYKKINYDFEINSDDLTKAYKEIKEIKHDLLKTKEF